MVMTNPAVRGSGPALRLLSLGAGVQSTTVLLLACDGEIPSFDMALFADTGWEPRAVYATLDRLTAHAAKKGIPVRRVSAGNIRTDALDPRQRIRLDVANLDRARVRPRVVALTVGSMCRPDIGHGEFVTIEKCSGSGKTTLLNMLAGTDRPTSGTIAPQTQNPGALSESGLAAWRDATSAWWSSSSNCCDADRRRGRDVAHGRRPDDPPDDVGNAGGIRGPNQLCCGHRPNAPRAARCGPGHGRRRVAYLASPCWEALAYL